MRDVEVQLARERRAIWIELRLAVRGITKPDGSDSSFTVGSDSKLVSVQMVITETPPAVRKTIEANTGEGKLGNIYKMIDGKDISYIVILYVCKVLP